MLKVKLKIEKLAEILHSRKSFRIRQLVLLNKKSKINKLIFHNIIVMIDYCSKIAAFSRIFKSIQKNVRMDVDGKTSSWSPSKMN